MNYILILLLIYILWRIVSGFPGAGKKNRENREESPDLLSSEELMQDPVCGMYVPKSTAFKVKKEGERFYFCGEECRRKFLGKEDF